MAFEPLSRLTSARVVQREKLSSCGLWSTMIDVTGAVGVEPTSRRLARRILPSKLRARVARLTPAADKHLRLSTSAGVNLAVNNLCEGGILMSPVTEA